VADTGPGVRPEIAKRIFEPFFTTKPEGQGTGLGLSICYQIAEEHGGTITLESEPGRGARFVLELPVAHPRAEPNRERGTT
jgi:two-component system NtrC family sensor kinase